MNNVDYKKYYTYKVLNYFKNKEKYNAVIRQVKSYSLHNKDGEVICFSTDALLK